MRIALITIWHENNYGAELQAYATIKAIQALGHSVKLINIRLSDFEQRSFKGEIANIFGYISPAYRKFEKFWSANFSLTQRYRSINELIVNAPDADLYMVGSDQVWNPEIVKGLTDVFFLNFGRESVKRISYASSFGTETWKFKSKTIQIKRLLSYFDYVTCREESGVALLKDEFNIEAKCVLDPTLLFRGYPELTGDLDIKNTLVYYPLYHDPELTQCAQSLSNILKLQLVNNKNPICLFNNFVWDCNSIEEWVKNIAETKFVLTRSFHGLAFSLLYERQFAIIGSKNNRSTRIENLLIKLNLEDRYFNSISDFERQKPWLKEINYSIVSKRLEELRTESWSILKRMLEI